MKKLKFLSKTSKIKEEINGDDVYFYSARSGVLAEFEVLANDVVKAVQEIFRDDEKLRGNTHNVDRRGQRKKEKGEEGAPGWASENISNTTMPIDPEVLAAMDRKSAENISNLIRSLMGSDTRRALASLIVSSCRDNYEADKNTGMPLVEDVDELCAETDLETMIALSSAAIKANWKGLTAGFRMTLPKRAGGLLQKGEQAIDRVLTKLGEDQKLSPSPSEDSSTGPASTSSEQESPESES